MSYASTTQRASSKVDGWRARRGGRHASTGGGTGSQGSGFADLTGRTSKVWLGLALWFISHDMNAQLDHINDLLEKDSELRDVCGPFPSGVPSYQSTENQRRSPRPGQENTYDGRYPQ